MAEISQYSLKFRPRRWEDVYGQDNIVKSLRKRILADDPGSVLLFQGQYGCGKTTLAEMYAAAMEAHLEDGNPDWSNPSCKAILNGSFDRDVMRLDGSQLSGKSDIIDFTHDLNLKPMYDRRKVLIIEEVDQVSAAAQSSLLKVLEGLKPWVTVILLSMEDKVSNAIKSRCQVYKVNSMTTKDIMYNLKHIMEQTGDWTNPNIPSSFKMEGLATIAGASQKSMRSAVQYLERCIINETYTREGIEDLLGVVDEEVTWRVLDALLDKSKDESVWNTILRMKTGDQTMHFVNYATMMMSEALLAKEVGVTYSEDNRDRLMRMGTNPNAEALYYCLTLHPQMNKPFIRTSDLLGALVCYYQNIDFRPQKSVTVVEKTINPVPVAPKEKDELERIVEATSGNPPVEEPKIVIGVKDYELPFPKETKPPIRRRVVRGVKDTNTNNNTNIGEMNLTF